MPFDYELIFSTEWIFIHSEVTHKNVSKVFTKVQKQLLEKLFGFSSDWEIQLDRPISVTLVFQTRRGLKFKTCNYGTPMTFELTRNLQIKRNSNKYL